MLPIVEHLPPPMEKQRGVRIKYVTVARDRVEAFAFFANYPQYITIATPVSWRTSCASTNFTGVPIRVFFRKK